MKFSLADGAVTSIIFLLVTVLLVFFWKDLNRMGSLHEEEPLGTIVFRKRSATRRYPASLNWERLKNNSSVYNQDLLRTSDFSEAVLYFDDQTKLDLFENTMLKLNFKESTEQLLDFREGRMSLTGGEGTAVRAGMRTVRLSRGSRVSFAEKDDAISIELDSGEASLMDGEGQITMLSSMGEYILDKGRDELNFISHSVDLTEPAQNGRLISVSPEAGSMQFLWYADKSLDGEELVLDMSTREDFLDATSYPVSGGSLTLKEHAGTWFWRIRKGDEVLSSVSRYSLIKERLTQPILPADDALFSYRRIPPGIVFSWSPMENAGSYVLEVSAEENFLNPIVRYKTTLNSITLDALDEGEWFWRVRPELSMTVLGGEPGYRARTLRIEKSPEMLAPVLFYPVNNTLYELDSLNEKGLTLSWDVCREAKSYEIRLASDSRLERGVKDLVSEESYIVLNSDNAEYLAREGVSYWSVRWQDLEGNKSPWSHVRKLQGVDEEAALRLSYPPDRYRIADSLVRNTRFTWKTNIPGRAQFQLSRSPDFSEVLYEEDVQAETLLGRDWLPGRLYWRLRTFNADGSVFLDSPARRFDVVDPLPEPPLISPAPGRIYIYREGDEQTIRWDPVDGTDCYTLKIIPLGSSEAVFEQALIEEEKISLPFDDYPNGNYRISLQGFAHETPMSTRIIGYMSQTAVTLRRLSHMEMVYPIDNPSFEGLKALREGIPLKWTAGDLPDVSEISLYSADSPGEPIFFLRNPEQELRSPALPEGRYYWKLTGILEGFDISAPGRGSFSVDPIPPLAVPEMLAPKEGYVLDADALRRYRKILFDWRAREGANVYEMEIYKKGSDEALFSTGLIEETYYLLTDLSILDKGDFIWVLHGEFRNEKGVLEQPGNRGSSRFSVDLPDLEQLELESGEPYFGN